MIRILAGHDNLHIYFYGAAPSVFSILFGLIKPFMSQYTVQKIKIHSSVKEQWHPEVLELIDPSQIREEFGGTKI